MILTKREILQGARFPPWYYAYSYRDWQGNAWIYYPVPINLIVRLYREIKSWWNWKRSDTLITRFGDWKTFQAVAEYKYTQKTITELELSRRIEDIQKEAIKEFCLKLFGVELGEIE